MQMKNRDLEAITYQIKNANQDLSRLSELKTKFFHIVTHEIRNPLGIISGYSQILNMEMNKGLTPEQVKCLDNISKASGRANLLLNDLTDLVAIEGGKFKVQLAPMALSELLQNARPSLEFVTNKKNIQLVMECASDLPPVLVDENRFTQVFINLVTNSSKFTPEGGLIRIRIANDGSEPGMLLIQVQDNGVGFMPEDREKIFERFYQAKNQDRYTQQKGFGLGLFIVSEILKLHSAKIWADSEGLGKGATFWIRMPSAVAANQAAGIVGGEAKAA
jgi:signal transduction histidine kinase